MALEQLLGYGRRLALGVALGLAAGYGLGCGGNEQEESDDKWDSCENLGNYLNSCDPFSEITDGYTVNDFVLACNKFGMLEREEWYKWRECINETPCDPALRQSDSYNRGFKLILDYCEPLLPPYAN